MPRPPRVEYAGAFYHVITRGNRRQPIFHKNEDYQKFLGSLGHNVNRYRFHLYAYVLMPNHFHLLLEQEQFPLSRLMQVLLTGYAQWHNRRYQQIGHLFQGRYRALLCAKESYLLELTRYIHLNPVRAKIVESPELYPWSSYQAYLGKASPCSVESEVVLGLLAHQKAAAQRAYEEFVYDALGEGRKPELYAATEQRFLGDDRFVETSKKRYRKVTGDQATYAVKPQIRRILDIVSEHTGCAAPLVVGRTEGEAEKKARELVAGIARGYFGFSLAEVADALNRRPNTISVLARQLADRLQKDETAGAVVEKLVKSIK